MNVNVNAIIKVPVGPGYEKEDVLLDTVRWLKSGQRAVIMCETRKKCDVILKEFRGGRFRAQSIHSGYLPWQRDYHVGKFHEGRLNIIIGTPATLVSLALGQVDLMIDYDGIAPHEYDPMGRVKERVMIYHLQDTGKYVTLSDS